MVPTCYSSSSTATAAQIWALAGYDLVTAESGDTKRLGHITKRGSPAFRDALYQIGYHSASQCPPILDARARGRDQVAASWLSTGKDRILGYTWNWMVSMRSNCHSPCFSTRNQTRWSHCRLDGC
ncbi:MAG: IS110 family transposase [Chloroflexi bacterium]|nr:IS110 family transposase [Chloroflexota bacterium]MBU1751332.1 IS110 family transposase [Chloroflexota bacterium]